MEELRINISAKWEDVGKQLTSKLVYEGRTLPSSNLMQDEINTARSFFDNVIESAFLGDPKKKEVAATGLDHFDLICVDGKDLRKHCEEIYNSGSRMFGRMWSWNELSDKDRELFMKVEAARTMADPSYKVTFRSIKVDDNGYPTIGEQITEFGSYDPESAAQRVAEEKEIGRRRQAPDLADELGSRPWLDTHARINNENDRDFAAFSKTAEADLCDLRDASVGPASVFQIWLMGNKNMSLDDVIDMYRPENLDDPVKQAQKALLINEFKQFVIDHPTKKPVPEKQGDFTPVPENLKLWGGIYQKAVDRIRGHKTPDVSFADRKAMDDHAVEYGIYFNLGINLMQEAERMYHQGNEPGYIAPFLEGMGGQQEFLKMSDTAAALQMFGQGVQLCYKINSFSEETTFLEQAMGRDFYTRNQNVYLGKTFGEITQNMWDVNRCMAPSVDKELDDLESGPEDTEEKKTELKDYLTGKTQTHSMQEELFSEATAEVDSQSGAEVNNQKSRFKNAVRNGLEERRQLFANGKNSEFKEVSELSKEELDRAYGLYHASYGNLLTSAGYHFAALNDGKDDLDMIHINGRTAKELFAEKYKDLPQVDKEKRIAAEIMRASILPNTRVKIDTLRNDYGVLHTGEPRSAKPEMTIGQAMADSPYAKYALAYVAEKGLIGMTDFAAELDKKYNIQTELQTTVKDPETGAEKVRKQENPSAWETKNRSLAGELSFFEMEEENGETKAKFQITSPATKVGKIAPEENVDYDRRCSDFMHTLLDEYDKYCVEHAQDEDFLAFKPMMELNFLPLRYEDGDFTQVMADSPYLMLLHQQVGGMPNFTMKSYKELREYLDGPADEKTGKETKPLKLMSAYYQGIVNLFELEYEKQRLLKSHPTPGQKQAYLVRLKNGMQAMVDAYEKLYAFVEEHPGEYRKGEFMNNGLDHLTGVAMNENRDPHQAIGQLRGQIKAIENGWDPDELLSLGSLEGLRAVLENDIRKGDRRIMEQDVILKRHEESYKKNITAPAAKLEQAQKEYDALQVQINEVKQGIREQEAALKQQPGAAQPGTAQNNAAQENAKQREVLEGWKQTLAQMETLLAEKQKAVDDAGKAVDRVEEDYRKSKEQYLHVVQRKEQSEKLLKELKELEEEVLNKKVQSASDKREVLDTINEFSTRVSSAYKDTRAKDVLAMEIKSLWEELHTKVTWDQYVQDYPEEFAGKGIPEEFGQASERVSNAVDIYGPNPKHHVRWGKSNNVMEKEAFERTFTPYDASKLPFTETELAFLGMAYTGLPRPDVMQALNDCTIFKVKMGNEQKLRQNSFWTDDIFRNVDGPRQNLTSISGVVETGRMGAKAAAEQYVAGDRRLLAQIIQKGFSSALYSGRQAENIGSNSALFSFGKIKCFLNILDRDPELLQEFVRVNAHAPAGEQVNLEVIRGRAEVLRYAVNGVAELDEGQRNPDISDERRRQMALDKMKVRVLDEMIATERLQDQAKSVYLRKYAEHQSQIAGLMRNPETIGEAAVREEQFLAESRREKQIFAYLGTERGRAAFEHFFERLNATYGNGAMNYSQLTAASPRVLQEIEKFTLDARNEVILDRLSGEPHPSEKEMKELAADYIQNKTLSGQYAKELAGAEKDPLAHTLMGRTKKGKVNYDYGDRLQEYIGNMDFSGMEPEELKTLLQRDTFKEMTDKLYRSVRLEQLQGKKEAGPLMDEAIEGLEEGNEGTWFGKEDYDKVLKGLRDLNELYRTNREGFVRDGSAGVTAEIQRKQAELLMEMQAYMARKEMEFAQNAADGRSDNRNSRRRYDAMNAAKKSLQARIAFDASYDRMLADAADYKEYTAQAADMSVQNAFEITIPNVPGIKKLSAQGAKAGLDKLTRLAKDGVEDTPENRKVVYNALAALVLNEIIINSEKAENQLAGNAEDYKHEIRKLAENPIFEKCIPGKLNTESLREFLADAESPKKLKERFQQSVNKNDPVQNRKRANSVSVGGSKTLKQPEPQGNKLNA